VVSLTKRSHTSQTFRAKTRMSAVNVAILNVVVADLVRLRPCQFDLSMSLDSSTRISINLIRHQSRQWVKESDPRPSDPSKL